MTEREARDGAWFINTKLLPRFRYADAELLPFVGNHDRWWIKIYFRGLPPITIDEYSEVEGYVTEALQNKPKIVR